MSLPDGPRRVYLRKDLVECSFVGRDSASPPEQLVSHVARHPGKGCLGRALEESSMDADGPADPAAPSVLDAARFSVPQLPPRRTHRARVAQKLEQSSSVPLVLVSAPAGTGKTSAVA